MKKTIIIIVISSFLVVWPAFGQQDNNQEQEVSIPNHFRYDAEFRDVLVEGNFHTDVYGGCFFNIRAEGGSMGDGLVYFSLTVKGSDCEHVDWFSQHMAGRRFIFSRGDKLRFSLLNDARVSKKVIPADQISVKVCQKFEKLEDKQIAECFAVLDEMLRMWRKEGKTDFREILDRFLAAFRVGINYPSRWECHN